VAVEEGRVVGVFQIQSDGVFQAHGSALIVRPDRRGLGIGRRLVVEGFDRAGGRRIDLLATKSSREFYRGFRHAETRSFRIRPDGDDDTW